VRDLHRDRDGCVRSASIETSNGRNNQPITKLYSLEVNVEANAENDHPVNSAAQENCQSPQDCTETSSRLTRTAAMRAGTRMSEWTKTLRYLEDVMN